VFCNDVDRLNLQEIGPVFEHDPLFPQRVNAGFAELVQENTIQLRVWERGNGETLACGTGACAAAVAAVLNGYCTKEKPIRVMLPGGDLMIRYTEAAVLMAGDAETVFEGTVEI
jgi:carbamoyl-phosphate synthase large subunit